MCHFLVLTLSNKDNLEIIVFVILPGRQQPHHIYYCAMAIIAAPPPETHQPNFSSSVDQKDRSKKTLFAFAIGKGRFR